MQHDDTEGYPGDHSGERYINQIKPWKKSIPHGQPAHEGPRFSHQHAYDLGGSASGGHPTQHLKAQRGRWQRGTPTLAERQAQSKNDEYEVQEEAYNAKRPRGTAEISTM